MTTQANIYLNAETNSTVEFSDKSKPNIAVCFSGGGTRALTCAWGQYLGLKTLGINDTARYISSVSGGTWASSIYNFLPDNISTEELLGDFYSPSDLSLSDQTGKFNVNNLAQYSFGQAPKGSTLTALLESFALFLLLHEEKDYKWVWASLIAEYILEPFGLRHEGDEVWNSSKSFSLSKGYAEAHFPPDSPSSDDFVYLRSGRPFHIMNNNILKHIVAPGEKHNVVQLANQSTPVSTGARGVTPEGFSGNGTVETYGNNSMLEQYSAETSPVNIAIQQNYSLIDSVSTSSAFFGDLLASHFKEILHDDDSRKDFAKKLQGKMTDDHKKSLLEKIEEDIEDLGGFLESELLKLVQSLDLEQIVPEYNFWPLGQDSTNNPTQYSDGGSLENTGILGALAQTDLGGGEDLLQMVAFDNTSTPLQKVSGTIFAGAQAAPLFGLNYDDKTGAYKPFTAEEKDPTNEAFISTSLVQVFDNSADQSGTTPFTQLVEDLYQSNLGSHNIENSAPAFCQLNLTTVDNPLARVTGGRKVTLLYVQNAKMLDWQNNIGDPKLKTEIENGQSESASQTAPFKDFPYYNLVFKIGLEPKESNSLSQMWAWAIASPSTQLNKLIRELFDVTS